MAAAFLEGLPDLLTFVLTSLVCVAFMVDVHPQLLWQRQEGQFVQI